MRAPEDQGLGELQVLIVDAGDGATALVRAPGAPTLLVDGGSVATGALARPFLARYGGGLPDHVVVTSHRPGALGGLVLLLSGRDGLPGTEDDPAPAGARLDPGPDVDCPALECRAWAAVPGRTTARPGDRIPLGPRAVAVVRAVDERGLTLDLVHGAVVIRFGPPRTEGPAPRVQVGPWPVPSPGPFQVFTGPCVFEGAPSAEQALRVAPPAWSPGCDPGEAPAAEGLVVLASDGRRVTVHPRALDGRAVAPTEVLEAGEGNAP